MKSILGAVGAIRLHEACINLERLLADGLPVDSAMSEFNTEFSVLMKGLREAVC